MFVRKQKEEDYIKFVTHCGEKTAESYSGRPEVATYISKCIEHGATKVEITIPTLLKGPLEETLKALSIGDLEPECEAGQKHEESPSYEERHAFYEMIKDAYGTMKKIDALCILDSFNKTYLTKLLKQEELGVNGEMALCIAALLRVMGEAARNIDPETLTDVQMCMLGGIVIKDLEGVKRYLGILVLPNHVEKSGGSELSASRELKKKVHEYENNLKEPKGKK